MKLYQVDAFTSEPFRGNPAGVCPVDDISNDHLFQNIALEMNVAETAFLKKEKPGVYRLRWFSPEMEIEFCGHATLASAHVLWEKGFEPREAALQFGTLSGTLRARAVGNLIELDFPALNVDEVELDSSIRKALGIKPVFAGTDGKRCLIEIDDAAALRNMKPDFRLLRSAGATAFAVTSRSDRPEYDFISRFFAPGYGIDEDPVTGSAHSYLTPYWAKKLGKKTMTAYQASKRGGMMVCELAGNGRVLLRGQAVTVFEIDFALPV
jgi:PhzF family phenazine biosynthesis protein